MYVSSLVNTIPAASVQCKSNVSCAVVSKKSPAAPFTVSTSAYVPNCIRVSPLSTDANVRERSCVNPFGAIVSCS